MTYIPFGNALRVISCHRKAKMSGIIIDQLERLKTARGKELLAEDRLEDGKVTSLAPPPIPNDERIKIEVGKDGAPRVTVREP